MEIKAHKRNRTAIYPYTKGEASTVQGLSCGFFAVLGVCVTAWCVLDCTAWLYYVGVNFWTTKKGPTNNVDPFFVADCNN